MGLNENFFIFILLFPHRHPLLHSLEISPLTVSVPFFHFPCPSFSTSSTPLLIFLSSLFQSLSFPLLLFPSPCHPNPLNSTQSIQPIFHSSSPIIYYFPPFYQTPCFSILFYSPPIPSTMPSSFFPFLVEPYHI